MEAIDHRNEVKGVEVFLESVGVNGLLLRQEYFPNEESLRLIDNASVDEEVQVFLRKVLLVYYLVQLRL